MILLTDRPRANKSLLSTLGLNHKCEVVGVHQALTQECQASVIICDVAIDTLASTQVVHSALSAVKRREPSGVVFLARDPSQLTEAQAKALGANIILPSDAPPGDILAAIRSIKNRYEPARPARADGQNPALQAVVTRAGQSFYNMFKSAAAGEKIAASDLTTSSDLVITALRQHSIQGWLDIVWKFDDVTYQHCMLVAGLVAKFTAHVGLSLQHQRMMSQASLLHDIGKARIPFAILGKPGPLSPNEWQIMKTHAAVGYDMLAGQGGFDPAILDIVRHHHEYLDGSGYPDRLKADGISQFVRMTTICDVFAALIEKRHYKAPNTREKALSILHSMGGKLDETLLASFEGILH